MISFFLKNGVFIESGASCLFFSSPEENMKGVFYRGIHSDWPQIAIDGLRNDPIISGKEISVNGKKCEMGPQYCVAQNEQKVSVRYIYISGLSCQERERRDFLFNTSNPSNGLWNSSVLGAKKYFLGFFIIDNLVVVIARSMHWLPSPH